MVIPRITPLSIDQANVHINQWMVDSVRNRDFKRFKHLDTFSKNFKLSPSVNLGSVAVKKEDAFTAIALLEKIEYDDTEHLYLCALESNDGHSATLLLKTLIAACPTIRLRSELDERWKIAYIYYKIMQIDST
tara:strand:+ start:7435 stop:7833 length:399 start_codon:yes stop_codon:yes gene_type:complete